MMSAHFGTEVTLECQKPAFRSLTSLSGPSWKKGSTYKEMHSQFASGKTIYIYIYKYS